MRFLPLLLATLFGAGGGIAATLLLAPPAPPPSGSGSGTRIVDELVVQRIRIAEPDGSTVMVIGNSSSLPASDDVDGAGPVREGIPGIIFFNPLGEEIGGLIYPARESEGGRFDGGVQLSMDQIDQTGQAIALRHWRNGEFVRSMLEIVDYPTGIHSSEMNADPEMKAIIERIRGADSDAERERLYKEVYLRRAGEKGYLAQRIFLGSEGAEDRSAKLVIKDSRSQPRIRLVVDENDVPRIELLDAEGAVVRSVEP
ncbi:MAG: hypothetical protein R3323_01735 [Wenzhouxiangellaceae bacterium]|nr:hypothetical protein [Wenzhouxiangellaceae bacterium]